MSTKNVLFSALQATFKRCFVTCEALPCFRNMTGVWMLIVFGVVVCSAAVVIDVSCCVVDFFVAGGCVVVVVVVVVMKPPQVQQQRGSCFPSFEQRLLLQAFLRSPYSQPTGTLICTYEYIVI